MWCCHQHSGSPLQDVNIYWGQHICTYWSALVTTPWCSSIWPSPWLLKPGDRFPKSFILHQGEWQKLTLYGFKLSLSIAFLIIPVKLNLKNSWHFILICVWKRERDRVRIVSCCLYVLSVKLFCISCACSFSFGFIILGCIRQSNMPWGADLHILFTISNGSEICESVLIMWCVLIDPNLCLLRCCI